MDPAGVYLSVCQGVAVAMGCCLCQETAVLCLYIWLLASLQGEKKQ